MEREIIKMESRMPKVNPQCVGLQLEVSVSTDYFYCMDIEIDIDVSVHTRVHVSQFCLLRRSRSSETPGTVSTTVIHMLVSKSRSH